MKFEHQTRRSLLRTVLAGLLGLLGVTLVRRSQVCAQAGACDGCAQFAACTLPKKVAAACNLAASGGTPLPRQERP